MQKVNMEQPYTLTNISLNGSNLSPDSILSRTLYGDDSLKAILFEFAVGQELSEHTASMPAIIFIISGEATLTLGPDTHEVKAGAWAQMQAKLPHSILAHTPVVMLLLMLKGAKE
jgi:quercetin dioxygenase-like cupin family protein